ncbi:MAG: CoA transferase, partial [Chloroflexi bacterium]|nr:CoA transferase [Chloroflexota bacterium]
MTGSTIPHPHAPLRGLRVLEWSRSIAAAYTARLLADAGAVVAKVEPPDGDPARRAGPFPHDQPHPERSGLHAYLNRGKRSVVLDTDAAGGHDALRRLAAAADILVHDQVALAESALGLGAHELRAASPRLVVTSVTPFGERGPRARWRADDLIVVASSDLAFATPGIPDSVQDAETEPPLRPDANVGEYVGGLMGAVGTMAALLHRDRSGTGDHVEVAQQEALAAMLNWDLAMYSYGDIILGRYPARMLHAPNHYMPIADGWAVIVAFLDAHWQALVDLIGTPEWTTDPRFATGAGRGEHWDELEPLLLGWLLDQPGHRLLEQCQGRGIPCAPALSVPEAVDSPQVAAREFLVPSGLPNDTRGRLPGDVVVVDRQRRPTVVGAPALGADTAAVLAEWLSESAATSPSPRAERGSGGE